MPHNLLFWVIAWVIVSAAILILYSLKAWPTTGLLILFILDYSMQYWVGAMIHALPWWFSPNTYFVRLGMEQCVYALIGLGIGCIVIAPLFVSFVNPTKTHTQQYQPNPRLPVINLIVGCIFYFLLPIQHIPTIRNLVYMSWNFIIANLCLLAWQAHITRNRRKFFLVLIFTLLFPFFTTFTMGFLGFGTEAALTIFAFVYIFFRPRIVSIVGILLAVYLGLSVFVTYFRDRDLIRASLQESSVRNERINVFFKDFELIDFHNPLHLQRMDERLNHCYLVGVAVFNVQKGFVSYAKGETIAQAFLAIIPRILWPDKPMIMGGHEAAQKYTGIEFPMYTSVGIGTVMEFYFNFGTPLVLFGFMLFGTLLALADCYAKKRLEEGDWLRFIFYFMLGTTIVPPLASVHEIIMFAGGTIFFYAVLMRLVLPMVIKLKIKVGPASGPPRADT